jgi:L-aspartate oxidase
VTSPRHTAYDLVVVGSGIAGLYAALQAHEAGARVLVVTKGGIGEASTRYAQGGIAAAVGPDDDPRTTCATRSRPARGSWTRRPRASSASRPPTASRTSCATASTSTPRTARSPSAGRRRTPARASCTPAATRPASRSSCRSRRSRSARSRSSNTPSRPDPRRTARGHRRRGLRHRRGRTHVFSPHRGPRDRWRGADVPHDHEPARLHRRRRRARLRMRRRGHGHGVHAVPPDRPRAARPAGVPHLGGRPRRGRAALQHARRALHAPVRPGARRARPSRRGGARRAERDARDRQRPRPAGRHRADAAWLAARFPKIYARCLEAGLDMAKDRIPVSPAAHYTMGGVRTNTWGETTVPRALRRRRVACTGVHGANRLASNSLLETVVFAHRAVERLLNPPSPPPPPEALTADAIASPRPSRTDRHRTTDEVKELMWREVGIVRTARACAAPPTNCGGGPRRSRSRPTARATNCAHRHLRPPRDGGGAHPRGVARRALPHGLPEPREEWRRHIVFRRPTARTRPPPQPRGVESTHA